MTLTPEEHKAATELAERLVSYGASADAVYGRFAGELARALLDRNERLQHVTEAIKTALSAIPGVDAKILESYTDDTGQWNALKAFRAYRVEQEEAIDALTRERDEARLVVGHMMKRLNDEYGVELSEEWAQRVAGGEHDVPFPESTLRAELETVKRERVKTGVRKDLLLKLAEEKIRIHAREEDPGCPCDACRFAAGLIASATELSALRTRLETDEKDTKRMDWLQESRYSLETWQSVHGVRSSVWDDHQGRDTKSPAHEAATVRDAIDAAMSATQPEGKP